MSLSGLPWIFKIIISVVWDALDLTIGNIPGFETVFDIIGLALAVVMWMPLGIIALWEVTAGGGAGTRIPTMTIIAVITFLRERKV